MNKLKVLVLASCLALSATAQADWSHDREWRSDDRRGWARVISSVPQYEWVRVARQQCVQERGYGGRRGDGYEGRRGDGYGGGYYRQSEQRSIGGAVIGGVAGGVIGNQIGDGRIAGTAIGAAVGAIVGDRIANNGRQVEVRHAGYSRPVERCRTVYERERRLAGYAVTYKYNGRLITRLMDRDPGRRVYVEVAGRGRDRY